MDKNTFSSEENILQRIQELKNDIDSLEREGLSLRKEIVELRDKMQMLHALKKISITE